MWTSFFERFTWYRSSRCPSLSEHRPSPLGATTRFCCSSTYFYGGARFVCFARSFALSSSNSAYNKMSRSLFYILWLGPLIESSDLVEPVLRTLPSNTPSSLSWHERFMKYNAVNDTKNALLIPGSFFGDDLHLYKLYRYKIRQHLESLTLCRRCCCFSPSAYWLPTRKNYFTRRSIPLVMY